jgi:hypothetical protein
LNNCSAPAQGYGTLKSPTQPSAATYQCDGGGIYKRATILTNATITNNIADYDQSGAAAERDIHSGPVLVKIHHCQ